MVTFEVESGVGEEVVEGQGVVFGVCTGVGVAVGVGGGEGVVVGAGEGVGVTTGEGSAGQHGFRLHLGFPGPRPVLRLPLLLYRAGSGQ